MAKTAKSKIAPAGGQMWLLGMASGLLIMLAAPTAALLGILLLPSAITWFADRSASHAMARIVLVAGLAMCIGPEARLWAGGAGWSMTAEIMSDIRVPAGAWAVQAMAWLAGVMAPLAVQLALDITARAQAARLLAARARLETDWGLSSAPAPRDP